MANRNPFKMLKQMLPAYFTALGTQSSAATIPVTLKHAKQIEARNNTTDFAIPLLATIHLSGSTITLVSYRFEDGLVGYFLNWTAFLNHLVPSLIL